MRSVLVASSILGLACTASASDLLFENGGIVTHPGEGAGGADVSMAGGAVTSAGANATAPDFGRADWFWANGDWTVDRVTVYAYETGAGTGESPFEGYNVDIWDGIPGQDGAEIVASSTDGEAEWSGIYRIFNGNDNLDNTDRPVFQIDVAFDDVDLEPGFYWVSYGIENDSAAWTPYVMEPNPDDPENPVTPAGEALVFSDGEWAPSASGDDDFRTSFPIEVYGTSTGDCPEDLTGDGSVGGADLGTLLAAWGDCADPDNCPEDLTGDGSVGGADLGTLLAAWGDCPGETVPQPDKFGACCFGDGNCELLTAEECANAEGNYEGDFISCNYASCPMPLSNCCSAHGGEGCDNEACEETVCDIDLGCCFNWDTGCADLANQYCPEVCSGQLCGDEETGHCCGEHLENHCNDEDCCISVCGEDPFCCSSSWDAGCAMIARDVCDICDVEINDATVYVINMRSTNLFFTMDLGIAGLDDRNIIAEGGDRLFAMEFDLDADTLYGIDPDPEPNVLVTIDLETGEFNEVATISGDAAGESTMGGLAFAPDGTVYASSSSSLYTIDINTAQTTLVGDYPSDAGLMIDIAIASDGTMYGHSISANGLYEIDRDNADATFIGEHGFTTNFAQGISMDRETDTLYATLYSGGGEGYYVQWDTETGETTVLLETTPWNAEMTMAIRNSYPE